MINKALPLNSQAAITDKLNRPIHDLRISVIDRCNFRCTYCMPVENNNINYLNKDSWLSFEEITKVTKSFVNLGVRKVRLTGGEPLLRPNITELIKKLSALKGIEDLALTTNGSLLKDYAQELKDAGLNRITISIDTLDKEIFKFMSGERGSVDNVLEGIKAAEKVGFKSIKLNTVIQKGVNDHCILDFINYFKNSGHTIRFIEYMDVGNCNHWQHDNVVPSKDILQKIKQSFPLEALDADYFGEVAKKYRLKDENLEIGFITSITKPFCSSCTRARLSTDGKIYTCLFSTKGFDLKQYLKDEEELKSSIKHIWNNRDDRYSETRSEFLESNSQSKKIEMYQIGG